MERVIVILKDVNSAHTVHGVRLAASKEVELPYDATVKNLIKAGVLRMVRLVEQPKKEVKASTRKLKPKESNGTD